AMDVHGDLAALHGVDVIDHRPGVLHLRHDIGAGEGPAPVSAFDVEGRGVAAGALLAAHRHQPRIEIHPAPGHVGVVVRAGPARVQAGGAQVDPVAAADAAELLRALGIAAHDAEADAVSQGKVHAELGAGVLLAEAEVAVAAEARSA